MADRCGDTDRLRLIDVYRETISDGWGIRYSIYLAGCAHCCPGCHNPDSWDEEAGLPLSDEMLRQMIGEIKSNPLLDGITLSGGDPFFRPALLYELLKTLKTETGMSVWCYTGYTYEELIADDSMRRCLPFIDVLVDGRFVQRLFDPTLLFRGSSNQRILRLVNGCVV